MINILRSCITPGESDGRDRMIAATRYALMAVVAVIVLAGKPNRAEAQAAPPTDAARFDIGNLLDPNLDADGVSGPDRLMSGHDPFSELGGGGQQPPLFFCEEAPDADPLGLDLDSPSIAFQVAKQVHRGARSKAGLIGQRLEHLGQIQLLMQQYLALGRGDPNKIPEPLKKRYETLKMIFDLNDPLNRDLQAKWGEVATKAQALRTLIKQAVTAERQAGLVLRRCAILLAEVDTDLIGQIPVVGMIDQPDYVDYSGLAPSQFTLEGHECATVSLGGPTNSPMLEKVRYFIKKAKAHLQAAMKREEAYHQAAFRASKLAGASHAALRGRLEAIARTGRAHNNSLRTLWGNIVVETEALETKISIAEAVETRGAKAIHRCKKGSEALKWGL